MGKNNQVFVIFNDSYGEVVSVTDSKEVSDRIMREELEKYGYDEEFIEQVIAGDEYSDFISVQTSVFRKE